MAHAWLQRHAAGCAVPQKRQICCSGSLVAAQLRPQLRQNGRSQHAPVRHAAVQHQHPRQFTAHARSRRQDSSLACAAELASRDGVTAEADTPPRQPLRRVRIRAARLEDAEAIADLCGQSFASEATANVGRLPPSPSKDRLLALEASYGRQIAATLLTELRAALTAKMQAAADAREWRLYRRYVALKAEIAALRGGRATFAASPNPVERRQVARWDRQRTFAVLLAHDADSGQLLGCVTLSLLRAEAALPPPLPTNKPLRLYISNMVVAPEVRRRGIASALLQACARLGRRWRQDSTWLHVEERNTAALGLYQAAGFRGIMTQRRWASAFRRCRLMSQPQPRSRSATGGAEQGPKVTGGSTRDSDGVFIWQTDAAPPSDGSPS